MKPPYFPQPIVLLPNQRYLVTPEMVEGRDFVMAEMNLPESAEPVLELPVGLNDEDIGGPIRVRPREKPPMWDEITKAFDTDGKDILYAFGRSIFRPFGDANISQALYEHEKVHCVRQMSLILESHGEPDPIKWWQRYIADPQFRLTEEIVAHYAEYQMLSAEAANREERRRALSNVARKLCSPLYGSLITIDVAKTILKSGPERAAKQRQGGVRS